MFLTRYVRSKQEVHYYQQSFIIFSFFIKYQEVYIYERSHLINNDN